MARRRLIIFGILVCAIACFRAPTPGLLGAAVQIADAQAAESQAADAQRPESPSAGEPPAQLIRPKVDQPRPAHPHLGPVDDRCKPLKDQLEAALQKSVKSSRSFQARVAHNAGTRFCREGRADRGLAELQRGLSYLQAEPRP